MLFTYKKSKNTSRVLAVVVISAIAIGIISTVIQPFVANAQEDSADNSDSGISTGGSTPSSIIHMIPTDGGSSSGNGGVGGNGECSNGGIIVKGENGSPGNGVNGGSGGSGGSATC